MKWNIQKLCFKLFLVVVGLSAWSSVSPAKVWRNSYLSFEIPDAWKCSLENTEWICRAEADKESKEAIIVLTAKEVGPMDTFDAYISHLNAPQTSSYKGATGVLSKVVYPPKKVMINDQPWIDGLHMASEVPNYFTRYLATIKDKIAVLFTCSAHKDYYTKYSQDFFKAVQSLRVVATKDLLSKPDNGIRHGNDTLGAPIGQSMPSDLLVGDNENNGNESGDGSNTRNLFLALAFILAALGGYIYFKSRKK
jgi:hypothetical protein